MSETKLVTKCREQLTVELPNVLLWKICDRMTGGQPDLEINWNGATSKIEFKVLHRNETVHDKWEDERQPITCVRYEQQTGRCWVVAFQQPYPKGERHLAYTLIYRPTGLLDGKVPAADVSYEMNAAALWEKNVIRLVGFNHHAIAQLIRQTHI